MALVLIEPQDMCGLLERNQDYSRGLEVTCYLSICWRDLGPLWARAYSLEQHISLPSCFLSLLAEVWTVVSKGTEKFHLL